MKETLDDHNYKALTYGLHYQSTLSISTVVRVLDTLLSTDYFDEHFYAGDHALEMHLRCIIAALQTLTIYGNHNCAPFLTFDFLERVYHSMAKWAQYNIAPSRVEPVLNFDNEFLLVYARDLISSLSSDRDLMVQAVTKIAGGLSLGPMVLSLQ